MRKIWVVIRREFGERVCTRWFVFSTVLGPLLMGTIVLLTFLMSGTDRPERWIAIVDGTGTGFGVRFAGTLTGPVPIRAREVEVSVGDIEAVAESLSRVVGEKKLDGFLIVSEETIRNGSAEYRGANAASRVDMDILQRLVQEAVLTERLRRIGVDPQIVALAQADRVELETVTIRDGETTQQSGVATFAVAYAMWFLLYVTILVYGVQVLGAVVEDKTSRIVEVLLSSIRPFELLAGKVIGVGGVGLFQLSIWVIAGRLLLAQCGALLDITGVEAEVVLLPSLPEVPYSTVLVFLVYFILGFLLYAAAFAAIAATSSSDSEARQAQAPVSMLFAITAMVSLVAMIAEPDGPLFVALTMMPFSSPVAMPARWVVSDVQFLELFVSILLLFLSVWVVTWVAGRIFRVGILAQGKRPNPRELWRWIRAS